MAVMALCLAAKEWKRLVRIMMLKTQASPDSAVTGATGPDALLFREGMSRVAGGRPRGHDGRRRRAGRLHGDGGDPVTDSPASLLVCVNTASRSAQALLANRRLLREHPRALPISHWRTSSPGAPASRGRSASSPERGRHSKPARRPWRRASSPSIAGSAMPGSSPRTT